MLDINIPSPGESITEVEISTWLVNDGDYVEQDQEIAEIESDKATLPLIAQEAGVIHIKIQEAETVAVGTVACTIDTEAKRIPKDKPELAVQQHSEKPTAQPTVETKDLTETEKHKRHPKVTPVAQKLMAEHNLDVEAVLNGLKRIGKNEVAAVLKTPDEEAPTTIANASKGAENMRHAERKKITQLRKKLSQRLVSVKNKTAMLTTFNEVDLSEVIRLRKSYQKQFTNKHGIKLGFMSFFTKAVTIALKAYPAVNSQLDSEEVITPAYADIGIAVQTPKGLMVPVIRNAETLSLAQIEQQLAQLAEKARKGRISLDEITGGTFTITNGGVFGSMLSTPIINPPQSGILGMHNIQDRPIAIDGQVVIRPMMYIALSYDHRLIDGKDSVGFLVKVKQLLENPQQMLLGTQHPDNQLLDL